MEADQTKVLKEELDYWCKEYPELSREEVAEILECIDIEATKTEFWENNPELPEESVDSVVAQNASASYDYHLYTTLNNEAQ